MKIKLQRDNVLVELDPFQSETESGLAIPGIAKEKPKQGTVIATGPGVCTKKRIFIPVSLKPGDKVIVPWATGKDMMVAGKSCVLLKEQDILATVS